MTAETTTLAAALTFTDQLAAHATAAAESVDVTIASLTQGGVTGPAIDAFRTAGTALAAAGAEMRQAHGHLTRHLTIRDAYTAAPDAGDRDYLTEDSPMTDPAAPQSAAPTAGQPFAPPSEDRRWELRVPLEVEQQWDRAVQAVLAGEYADHPAARSPHTEEVRAPRRAVPPILFPEQVEIRMQRHLYLTAEELGPLRAEEILEPCGGLTTGHLVRDGRKCWCRGTGVCRHCTTCGCGSCNGDHDYCFTCGGGKEVSCTLCEGEGYDPAAYDPDGDTDFEDLPRCPLCKGANLITCPDC